MIYRAGGFCEVERAVEGKWKSGWFLCWLLLDTTTHSLQSGIRKLIILSLSKRKSGNWFRPVAGQVPGKEERSGINLFPGAGVLFLPCRMTIKNGPFRRTRAGTIVPATCSGSRTINGLNHPPMAGRIGQISKTAPGSPRTDSGTNAMRKASYGSGRGSKLRINTVRLQVFFFNCVWQ